METKTYYIALDQSTSVTGYSIFYGQELLTYGNITLTGKDYIERIIKVKKWLEQILETFIKDEEVILKIGVEDIQLQENKSNHRNIGVTTYKKLAHLQGVIMATIQEKGVEYQLISPSSWRKTCGIKSKERQQQKRDAQSFIFENFGKKVTEDEADAICIGYHLVKSF